MEWIENNCYIISGKRYYLISGNFILADQDPTDSRNTRPAYVNHWSGRTSDNERWPASDKKISNLPHANVQITKGIEDSNKGKILKLENVVSTKKITKKTEDDKDSKADTPKSKQESVNEKFASRFDENLEDKVTFYRMMSEGFETIYEYLKELDLFNSDNLVQRSNKEKQYRNYESKKDYKPRISTTDDFNIEFGKLCNAFYFSKDDKETYNLINTIDFTHSRTHTGNIANFFNLLISESKIDELTEEYEQVNGRVKEFLENDNIIADENGDYEIDELKSKLKDSIVENIRVDFDESQQSQNKYSKKKKISHDKLVIYTMDKEIKPPLELKVRLWELLGKYLRYNRFLEEYCHGIDITFPDHKPKDAKPSLADYGDQIFKYVMTIITKSEFGLIESPKYEIIKEEMTNLNNAWLDKNTKVIMTQEERERYWKKLSNYQNLIKNKIDDGETALAQRTLYKKLLTDIETVEMQKFKDETNRIKNFQHIGIIGKKELYDNLEQTYKI